MSPPTTRGHDWPEPHTPTSPVSVQTIQTTSTSTTRYAPTEGKPDADSDSENDSDEHTAAGSANTTKVALGPPPDGGLHAWSVILSASLVNFCVFGFVTGMGQLETYYKSHQLSAYSPATIAWIASAQGTLTYLPSLVVGRYFDTHGPHTLVWAGTAILTASLICVACSTHFPYFLISHILYGLGGSLLYTPCTSIPSHYFDKRRSTAVAMVIAGAGAGGVVFPLLLQSLLDHLPFRPALLCVAGMALLLLLPACVLLRARLPPRAPPPLSALKEPWKDTRYACLVIGASIYLINAFAPLFDAIQYAATSGLNPSVVPYALTILHSGSLFGRLAGGPLADYFGLFPVFALTTITSVTTIFTFWTGFAGPGTATTIAGLVLFGTTYGAWLLLACASIAAISPPESAGMRIGMLWTVGAVPNLVGPVLCGLLISAADGKFTYAAIFTGCTYALGGAVALAPGLLALVRRAGSEESKA